MGVDAWISLGAVGAVLVALASNRVPADLALLGAALLLLACGVIDPHEVLAGFSNEGMLTVAALFVVAAAMQRSGAMGMLTRPLLGAPRTATGAVARLAVPISGLSGFINNTPMVAMMMPVVADWGRRLGISPSKLLLPLSYATVLGGMLTMIGTSTNLVVSGLLTQAGRGDLGMFTPTLLGAVLVVVGVAVLVILAPRMLPDRVGAAGTFADPRRFTVEATVDPGGPFADQPLALLRERSGGLNPVEIDRGADLIPAPGPDVVLHGGDRLILAGPAAAVLALHGVPGLTIAADHRFADDAGRRHLVEVVLSDRCPLVGEGVGGGSFRRHYGAAIIAVARHGLAVGGVRQADWILRPGDALLVEARTGFTSHPDRDRDFWMLTEHGAPATRTGWRAWAALAITVAMCTAAAVGLVPMLWAAFAAVLAIIAARVLSVTEARSSIDLQVVVAIAASFALGRALEVSGAAAGVAGALTSVGGDHPWLAVALIYITTALATELITNNAAAALILPIALATADHLGVAWMPFAMAVMFAASASFMTPIGYATNLMVWGPGGYTFGDFLRLGGILQLVVGVVSIALIPVIWPFATPG